MTVKRNIKSPLINQIKREIQHRIEEKVYRPEEKLPSIRTFAQEFKTSHETINIALNLLQQEGLIDKIPSRGSYVKDSSSTLDISRDKNGLIGLIINKSGTVNIDQMWPLYEQLIESIDTEIKKNAKILTYNLL